MWLAILIFVAVFAAAGYLIDRRTRRTGHRVPSGRDLNRRIPMGTSDNSRSGGTGNPITQSRFNQTKSDGSGFPPHGSSL